MSNYAASKTPPRTLTDKESKLLLTKSGEHEEDFRDHMIFSFALGTGLRETEILSLTCNDVFESNGKARRRVALKVFKGSTSKRWKRPRRMPQDVFIPDTLRYKLTKFRRWKTAHNEPVDGDSPLFVSQRNSCLSSRRLRAVFVEWQKECEFSRRYRFHDLRHTMLRNLYKKTKDIMLVKRAARHSSVHSTSIYIAPGDEEVFAQVKDVEC